jgi:hypothetical protein
MEHDHVHAFQTKAVAKAALVEAWNEGRLANPSDTQIMLAYNREDVFELNQLARGLRHLQGELGGPEKQETLFQTERGERAFAIQDRVYFLKNDRSLGVMNGTLGTIEAIREGMLTIRLDSHHTASELDDEAKRVSLTMERYAYLDHGYAATIHKAQGVTVDRSYVLGSQYLDAHSTYVAMSRHRECVDLFYGKETFLTRADLIKILGRDRAKDVSLDYSGFSGLDSDDVGHQVLDEKKADSFFHFTDADSRELDRIEKRLSLSNERVHEFKQSFYKDYPDLADQAEKSLDAYLGMPRKDQDKDKEQSERQKQQGVEGMGKTDVYFTEKGELKKAKTPQEELGKIEKSNQPPKSIERDLDREIDY